MCLSVPELLPQSSTFKIGYSFHPAAEMDFCKGGCVEAGQLRVAVRAMQEAPWQLTRYATQAAYQCV